MRATFLAGVSVIGVMAAGVLPAGAADLPARMPAPAPAAAVWSWTGLYLGSHAGNAWDRTDWLGGTGMLATLPRFEGTGTAGGGFAGAQIGYNYQTGPWVLGVELEGSAADLDGNARCALAMAICNTRVDAMGTLTGRLGWTFDNVLLYGRAGAAYAHAEHILTAYDAENPLKGDSHRFGWTVGGGVEYAVSPVWSAKLEYDYLHFGADQTTVADAAVSYEIETRQDIHRVKVGINRRLDWGLPGLPSGLPAAGGSAGVPVKAAPGPAVPAWTIEVGTRVWFSDGRYQKDLMDSGDPNRLNSRLSYVDMTGIAGETFGRFDHRSGLFVKGYFGAGALTNGTLHDEDFPAQDFYSNTVSEMKDGRLRYAGADIGWNVVTGPVGKLGAYVGYRYFHERGNGFGCAQIAGDSTCAPAISTTFLGLSETETWRGFAVGLNTQLQLTNRIRLEVDGAILPYASRTGYDNHWYRDDINPQIESGRGWGGQVEAVVSYAVTPQWSVGVGGRYWYYTTTDARTEFPGSTTDSPMKFTAERWGGFLQTSYAFDSTGGEIAAPAAAGVFKAPAAAPAGWSWTGVYVGAHAGAAWGRTEWTTATGTGREAWNDVDGNLVGGQIGADWQLGRWVVGVEGSFSWSDLDGNAPCGRVYTCNAHADGLGMLTGRLGWAFGNVLLYGKAGVAWLQTKQSMLYNEIPNAYTADETRTGWTVGSGLEYGLMPNWTAKVEYNWSDFGSRSVAMTDQFGGVIPVDVKQTVQDVRLGLNYRFGQTGPVTPTRAIGPIAGLLALGGPATRWTGVYAGLHVGGGHASEDWSNPFGPQIFGDDIGSGGWLAGGQVGYNHQIGSVVLGVEADASAANLDGTNTCFVGLNPLVGGVDCRSQLEMLATLTGRAGWAFDRSLVYVKGGAAFARDRRELNLVGVGGTIHEATTNRWGWTIGAGLEHAVLPNVSVKLEYDYVALGDDTVGFGLPPALAVVDNRSVSQDAHVAKLGVNYLFNTPLPVQAKY
ncbi:outer membrane beta-barrel protein [Rhodoplanes sp. TEM]|uniref:Outer membrane beta-barrel protein n=1 Tax=Rhodoplanes tepidamans TaxID=200616 RepID=A0ABT5JJL8_RHOTP|nr:MULTISPECIES: outer membrane beta-barrel protein [Rhodoplanes]MDC7789807.1 outer membrane beta-barrel protein [Rhodoplanes tepidamans]MDC7985558.1 outer membrane beta-barrel protein [Rhodoplanes sp. TEM]MDQ0355286.1 opacity protein-like surface antigen [Rhodoplanes tepidamans]